MDAIKKLFQDQKTEKKFKKAGEGHRLDEERKSGASTAASSQGVQQPRKDPGQAARTAGAAALARFEDKTAPKPKPQPTGTTAARQRSADSSASAAASEASQRRGSGDSAAAPKEEQAKKQVAELPLNPNDPSFLRMLQRDPVARAVYTIVSRNDEAASGACLATCCKYMENIVNNPSDDKYRRIRMANKVFQERVKPVEGALDFFEAVGFEKVTDLKDGVEEEFLVLPADICDSVAEVALLTLQSPPRPPIFRDVKIFEPTEFPTQHWELPSTFYAPTADDVRRMQEELKDRAEKELQLRTKAMRLGPNKDKVKQYRLTCLRVRLPDGCILQANFRVFEPMARVVDAIRDCMQGPCPDFRLTSHPDKSRLDEDLAVTLADLDLIPKALINLTWEGEAGVVLPEIMATKQPL